MALPAAIPAYKENGVTEPVRIPAANVDLTGLPAVAASGSYNDLTDKPVVIPSDFAAATSGYVLGDITVAQGADAYSAEITKTAVDTSGANAPAVYSFSITSSDQKINIAVTPSGIDLTLNP
jgi:hypothetical protein